MRIFISTSTKFQSIKTSWSYQCLNIRAETQHEDQISVFCIPETYGIHFTWSTPQNFIRNTKYPQNFIRKTKYPPKFYPEKKCWKKCWVARLDFGAAGKGVFMIQATPSVLCSDRSLRSGFWELFLGFFFPEPISQNPILTVRCSRFWDVLHSRVSWLLICCERCW